MSIPHRGRTSQSTYFITADTWEKKSLLQSERAARLFLATLDHYRICGKYLLHEFVVMPDHFHLLITPGPVTSLERAMQLIKGGFSYRAGKELGWRSEVWQTSFYDRRVRDAEEYRRFRQYIHENPVTKGLAESAEKYPFSSATGKYVVDEVPQRLKPNDC